MEGKYWVIVAAVIVGILVYSNVIVIPGLNTGPSVTTVTQMQQTVTNPVVVAAGFQPGDFIDDIMGYNSFTPSTTSTLAAIGSVSWYELINGVYTGVGASTGGTLQAPASTGGYVYAAVLGTTNYYIDSWKTKAQDSKIESVSYFDIDNNGVSDWVFKINLASVTRQSGYTPHFSFNIYFIPYGAPSQSNLSDTVSTVGTTQVDTYFEFYTTQSSTNTGYAMYRSDFTIMKCAGSYSPQADTAKFLSVKQMIPGKGYVDMSTTVQIRTYDLLYSYVIGSDMSNAYYVNTPSNSINKQYFTLDIKTSFTATDAEYEISWTLYYLAPAATGTVTPTTTTDNIWIKAVTP